MNVFEGLLIVFIALKLTDTVDWSWWLVFLPVWIPLGIAIVFGSIAVVSAIVEKKL